ncbi:uncharacterized protein LOC106873813 isoform X2 [Octopus bimaculoides]|uniref:uncharacterized protein LOC106873813 isoform X2 n=1 Tax=Octopus bimaculoides TaxID=37653 RepID=UPI0022E12AEB|nr:uncharacterized protein LOC106873813 isoform X2 [Octopus bimaculoides]
MNPSQLRQCLHFHYFLKRKKLCRNVWNCIPLIKKYSSSVDSAEEEDFFGISEKDSLGQPSEKVDEVVDKDYIYGKYLPKMTNKISDPSLEKVFQVPFGSIRLDSYNKHTLADKMVREKHDVHLGDSSFDNRISTETESNISNFRKLDASSNKNSEFEYIDNQYFSRTEYTSESKGLIDNKKITSSSANHILMDLEDKDLHRSQNHNLNNVTHEFVSDENFIDSQYFNKPMSGTTDEQPLLELNSTHRAHSLAENKEDLQRENQNFIDNQYFGLSDQNEGASTVLKKIEPVLTKEEPLEIKAQSKPPTHEEETENAFNVAMKIRKKLRKENVRDDIVAINKPYGLSSHGGPGVHVSLADLLPELAAKIYHKGTLHLIHRLDKETTGVLLLARTAEMAAVLHKMFREQEVIKKYWAITKGVPNPDIGIIDIPIAEGSIDGKSRMVLKPDYTEETRLVMKKSSVKRFEAVTRYKVLCKSYESALVECQPKTGVKHQVRVHLAFGLNTPIIGDHKYSHINKLAPQRLFPEILQRLNVRQSKVRYIPMHLHSKIIILPQLLDGKNLFIKADLPYHFRKNMKSLKLKADK